MAGTSDPGHTETSRFLCGLTESGLQCRNVYTQDEILISFDDILCILPCSVEGENGYRVLFLQKCLEEACFGAGRECIRLESIQTASLPSTLLSRYLCAELPRHLGVSSSSQRTDIHVIISSGSGTGYAKNVFQDVLKPLLSFLGLTDYEVHETRSDQTITDLARSRFLELARIGISQTIILLSGDGGLADVVDAFYSGNNDSETTLPAPPSIALIPTGTGNAMANSIGLLQRPISGLMTLLRGRPVPIPVFCASFSPGSQYITKEGRTRTAIDGNYTAGNQYPKLYGAVVASWGVHASLVADSDTAEYRRFGADRFKMSAKELLYPSDNVGSHRYNGVITLTIVDCQTGEKYTQTMEHNEHMYILATLVPKLEKDFVISPESKPLDGRLRVIHFGPMPSDEAMHLMTLAYQGGQHVHEKVVTYTEVERLRIEFQEEDEKWRRVCVDGKIIAVQQEGWMEVRKETKQLLNLITCMS